MGNMFGQPLEARLIKWKLGLLWKNDVKHTFYLDHYGRKWLALEFTGVCSNNRPWYVRGQIFYLERWTPNFSYLYTIDKLVVWARLPRLPVRYKEENIIKVIA